MIVFKLYLKLLNKNKLFLFIYFGIFLLMTIVSAQSFANTQTEYSNVKVNIAYFDEDNTEFTQGLRIYLENYANFKDIEKSKLDDAFFYREIEIIAKVPQGFTSSFLTETPVKLEIKSVPESTRSFAFQQAVDKYLNLARIYQKNNLATDNLSQAIQEILAKEATVSIPEVETNDYSYIQFFYNYIAYIVLALVVTVMGSIMISLKPIEIKRRNHIASVTNREMNMALLLGNALLGLLVLGSLMLLSIILYADLMFTANGYLIMLNSVIFTLNTIALSYFLVSLFDSRQVVGAIGTVLSLGSAFITGVFIPQEFLDRSILSFSQIFPSFWYVKANDLIVTLSAHNSAVMKPVYNAFTVQLITGAVFLVLSFVISKLKQQAES